MDKTHQSVRKERQFTQHRNLLYAVLSLLFLFFGFSETAAQQKLTISNGQFSKNLPSVPSRNIEYVSDGVIVTYTFSNVLSMQSEDKEKFLWKIPGFTNLADEGYPTIPNRVDIFTLDEKHDVKLSILEEEYTDYKVAMPAAGSPLTDLEVKEPVNEFSEMKQFKGFYPKETVSTMETEYYRGRPIFKFMVCPVQYNEQEKLTRFYTKLSYKITYKEASKSKLATAESVKQLPSLEENSIFERIGIPLIQKKENIKKSIGLQQWSEPGKKLLILTNSELRPAANRLADWKKCLGFDTEVLIIPPGRTPEQVKNDIKARYEANGLDYLLIIGDSIAVDAKLYKESATGQGDNPRWTPYYLSDHYYVCMDGDNDEFPDIHKGRIPSHKLEEAYNAVNKIIRYEKNPPSDPKFYQNGINLAQFERMKTDKTCNKERLRFIFSSENIRNYLMDFYNLNVERVYATKDALDSDKPFRYNAYFCYDGEYKSATEAEKLDYELMPDELQDLSVWKYYTAACGPFYTLLRENKPSFLFYSGHGDVDRWSTPSILVQNHLRNHHVFQAIKYPVMLFSICCQNGKFNRPDCFVNEWINDKSGAVGAFACTHFGLVHQQMGQVDLMINCIWPKSFVNFVYGNFNSKNPEYSNFPSGMTMGQVLDESLALIPSITNIAIDNSEYNYQRRVTHYFGDPTMRWYLDYPGIFTPLYYESGDDIEFTGNRIDTITVVFDTLTNEVTRHHNVQSLKINKEKAKHCVVTTVGYDIRPWSWIGEDVDLEVLSNQSILNY